MRRARRWAGRRWRCGCWAAGAPSIWGPCLDYQQVAWSTPKGRQRFLINRQPYPVSLVSGGRDAITGVDMTELPAYGVALMEDVGG